MDFVDIKPKLEPITLSSEEEDGPASRSLKNKPEIIEQEVRHIFYVNEAPENHSEDSLADEHVYSEDHFETHRFLSDSLTDDDEDLEENYRESDPTNDVNCETRRDPSPVLPSRRQNPENPSNCPASYKCKICNLQLKSKVFLIYHMKRIHNQKYEEPTMYTCRHCQKVFRSLNGLRNHLKTHNEKNFQQCPICQCKYLQNFYVNHVLTHESNTCLPCQVCGQIFKTPRERMKHWESHSKDFPYGCDYCYRRFRREQYLQNHLKIHCQYRCSYCGNEFGAGQPQKPPYICDSCQKKPEIRRKMEQKRSGGGGYLAKNQESAQNDHNCEKEIVQFVYMNDDDEEEDLADDLEFIKTNESITIDDYDEEETESNYNATEDGEPMEEEGVAQQEEEEKEEEDEEEEEEELLTTLVVSTTNKHKNKSKKYKCSYCNRDFKSQPGLNYHLTHAHDDTYCKKLRYKCKKCEKGFGTLQGLKTHKLLHDKNSYFKCPVCPIKNPLISQFLKHVMTHKRDTCHPCQVCGQVFDTDADRLKHWNTHAKDLPYDCDVCARRFRKPHVLIHHKKSHGQYNCYFCSAIFQSVHTLHTPYACPSCELRPDIREKVDFQRSLAEKKQV